MTENNFDEGFRKEMERQAEYNLWLKNKKSDEDTKRLLGQSQSKASGSENRFDNYSMALGGILGLIVMIFGNLGVVGFFLGSLIIVIGFFPRLLMIGLWILAGYIFLTQSMHSGSFDWKSIEWKFWVIIVLLILAGGFIDRKAS